MTTHLCMLNLWIGMTVKNGTLYLHDQCHKLSISRILLLETGFLGKYECIWFWAPSKSTKLWTLMMLHDQPWPQVNLVATNIKRCLTLIVRLHDQPCLSQLILFVLCRLLGCHAHYHSREALTGWHLRSECFSF